MASNLRAMASNLLAMASNLRAMASNQPKSDGLQAESDRLVARFGCVLTVILTTSSTFRIITRSNPQLASQVWVECRHRADEPTWKQELPSNDENSQPLELMPTQTWDTPDPNQSNFSLPPKKKEKRNRKMWVPHVAHTSMRFRSMWSKGLHVSFVRLGVRWTLPVSPSN